MSVGKSRLMNAVATPLGGCNGDSGCCRRTQLCGLRERWLGQLQGLESGTLRPGPGNLALASSFQNAELQVVRRELAAAVAATRRVSESTEVLVLVNGEPRVPAMTISSSGDPLCAGRSTPKRSDSTARSKLTPSRSIRLGVADHSHSRHLFRVLEQLLAQVSDRLWTPG